MSATATGVRHSKVSLFLELFLPAAIICVIGTALLFFSERNASLNQTLASNRATVQIGARAIQNVFQTITNDLAYMADHQGLRQFVQKPNDPDAEVSVLSDWLSFSRIKGIYDQIRWLDISGQERLRVNYNKGAPTIVPKNRLQNKGKRYYFTDTVGLKKGEFFISPLDLNIEQGKIEVPYKPTIRIGTPIFDDRGKKQGIMLHNYLGQHLLEEFSKVMGAQQGQAWLVNRDGYWLKGPEPDQEWAFMFKQPKISMAHRHPETWEKITRSEAGQFENATGFWTFSTIFPLLEGQKTSSGANEAFAPSRSHLESRDYFWKLVLLYPQEAYSEALWRTGTNLGLALTILLGGLCFGSWRLAHAWIREQAAEDELRRINLGLEETVAERTKELRNEINIRQKAEKELRERGERFRSITATASVAVIVTIDQDGKVVTWNPAAEKVFGYTKAEMEGKPVTLCMPERYREAHNEGLKRAVETKQNKIIGTTVELQGLRKNGKEFPIEMSLGTWTQGGIQYFSAIILDITERKAAEKKLKHMATHDRLTGLPTRVLANEHINRAMANARRRKLKAAVLFIDLDGFKAVNDTYGHDCGDRLLIDAGKRLLSCVREIDMVARIGGDEFLVILEEIGTAQTVGIVAEKLIKALARPFRFDDKETTIGASIGIAVYPDDADTLECLIKCADNAMYRVKSEGKNNFGYAKDLKAAE